MTETLPLCLPGESKDICLNAADITKRKTINPRRFYITYQVFSLIDAADVW